MPLCFIEMLPLLGKDELSFYRNSVGEEIKKLCCHEEEKMSWVVMNAVKNTSSYPLMISQALQTEQVSSFFLMYRFWWVFAFDFMIVGGRSDTLGYKNYIGS